MNLKYIIVIGLLIVAVAFLLMDSCGSSSELDKLKGEYKKASEIAKAEQVVSEEIIKEQQEEIGVLNKKIVVKSTTIARKNRELTVIEGELGELQKEFQSLEECQAQYDKLAEGFTLAKRIVSELGVPIEYRDERGNLRIRFPQGSLTNWLNQRFEAQLIISLEYEYMLETTQKLLNIQIKQVKELEKINRRLKLTSGLKSGIVITMAGVVLYSLLRK